MRWPDARVNIDPKEDDCVEPLVALLDRLDVWDRVCIGAFSDARLKRVRRLARGRACTSMGPIAVATAWLSARGGRMPRLGANCVQVPRSQGPFALVTAAVRRRGAPRRAAGARVDRRRSGGDAPAARPRRRRDHDQPAAGAARDPRRRGNGTARGRGVARRPTLPPLSFRGEGRLPEATVFRYWTMGQSGTIPGRGGHLGMHDLGAVLVLPAVPPPRPADGGCSGRR